MARTQTSKLSKKPFIIQIQPDVLSDQDSRAFMRLLREYIEKTGVPPALPSMGSTKSPRRAKRPRPRPSPSPSPTPSGGTLSNCRDTETEIPGATM
jgi:hypothetical protein